MAAGIVALAVVVAPAIKDSRGFRRQGSVSAKKLTVTEKGGTETVVTTTDDTEWVTKKRTSKIDLEKLSKQVTKSIDAGKKGVFAKVTPREGRRLVDLHRG